MTGPLFLTPAIELSSTAKRRTRWRALAAVAHEYRCADCGAEPIVQQGDDGEPIIACRMHRLARVEKRS